jgi:glucose/arabinose dehydrogenase
MRPTGPRGATRAFALAVGLLVAFAACGPAPPSRTPIVTPRSAASAAPSGSGGPAPSGPTGSPGSTPSPVPAGGSFDATGVVPVVTPVVGGLRSPVDVADPDDGSGRLFVVEQQGRIRIVRDGTLVERPFLDITDRIASGGERGLLGLAFHPDYPTDPRFFVDYTDLNGDTVVSSFRVSTTDPDVADRDSERILLQVDQPFANHNGGGTVFGPDGMLYIALGDGGSAGDPQGNGRRLDTLLAKILRISVDSTGDGAAYAIPPDNPFVDVANARPEIWLTGLRNPWRFRFDPANGDMWIGDVGQNAWEEIDVVRAGGKGLDFGWNVMEGFHCFRPSDGCDQDGLTLPVAEYDHDLGCAVIGGVVVRGPTAGALAGRYVFGDACSDNLWLLDTAGDGRREPVLVERMGKTLSSIAAAADGTVYATSLSSNELLRIAPPGS